MSADVCCGAEFGWPTALWSLQSPNMRACPRQASSNIFGSSRCQSFSRRSRWCRSRFSLDSGSFLARLNIFLMLW